MLCATRASQHVIKGPKLVPDMFRHGTDTGATTAVTKTGSKCTHEQLLGHIVTPVRRGEEM